ncbi:MAG: hypothetical protein K5764_10130 [Prevotella sp.]|nr:hypothetical protein [Prevotella sp.]
MRKVLLLIAALMLMGTADAGAQGFFKKLKQKAQAAVGISEDKDKQDADDAVDAVEEAADESDPSKMSIAQGSDIVPKRKTSTVTWDGVVTPSTASTSAGLLKELPPLPSAEKMARSTMEERDAYAQQIAAVVARAEQLREGDKGCSDAEIEALREKWDAKIQDLFGLTKEELAILNDEQASNAQKEPIRQKVLAKIMGGGGPNMSELAKLDKMSEKEQEAYLMAHPEMLQQMQNMAANSRNFTQKTQQLTSATNSLGAKMGKAVDRHMKAVQKEENYDYDAIAKRFAAKLKKLYREICATDEPATIDALYAEADELLYSYRIAAAKEYRASLQRQINESKKFYAEQESLMKEAIASGDLPACVLGRTDMNMVVNVANLLDDAYKELPDPCEPPYCRELISGLADGWRFCDWECRGLFYGGGGGGATDMRQWQLLTMRQAADHIEYGVFQNGKVRVIDERELAQLNKKADQALKQMSKGGQKPAYGVYKSRSGKRTAAYSQTGELIINGMTTVSPVAFKASADRLEWYTFDEDKLFKCTYKL